MFNSLVVADWTSCLFWLYLYLIKPLSMPIFFSKDGYAEVFNYWRHHTGFLIPNDIIDTNNRSVLGYHPYYRVNWYHGYIREDHPVISVNTKDSKHCFVDFNGKMIGQYDAMYTIISANGFHVAKDINGERRAGWVNNQGMETIPCKFDRVGYAGSNLLWCEIDGRKALFNSAGRQLTGFEYVVVNDFYNGYAVVKKPSGHGILSSRGEEITPFIYPSVDLFFVGHQYRDNNVYDVDSDEGRCAYCTFGADIEGPFRYGIASLAVAENSDLRLFVDTRGKRTELHSLREETSNK